MIYCLEGDSHALDGELKDILKKLNLDDQVSFDRPEDKNKAVKHPKKEMKKMDDEAKGLITKMSKIDIHKDERQAEVVIKRAMEQIKTVKKEQRSMVFRAVTELKNALKTDQGAITLREIRKKLDSKQISNEEIGAAIRILDEEGHIHYDAATEKIYM